MPKRRPVWTPREFGGVNPSGQADSTTAALPTAPRSAPRRLLRDRSRHRLVEPMWKQSDPIAGMTGWCMRMAHDDKDQSARLNQERH
jgi:hypothetical protein